MKRSDSNYLRTRQYANASNLTARIQLHARFSTNPYDWFQWVFDHIMITEDAAILELGCGSGKLWQEILGRIPGKLSEGALLIVLSDFSLGMLAEARRNLDLSHFRFQYEVVNAMDIPHDDESLDIVIANHMLYHVPDRKKALSEIRRVLKTGGRLYAATNGIHHLAEIDAIIRELAANLGETVEATFSADEFTLENGAAQLSPWFERVDLYHYPDSLVVTETEPLVAYIVSMSSLSHIGMSANQMSVLRGTIQNQMDANGAIRVTKATGLFIATKGV